VARRVSFLLALLLFCFASPRTVQAADQTLYVDDSNTTETENGTHQNPYRTIGRALAVARSGDTVNVSDGVYNETVTLIAKSGIILMGQGASTFVSRFRLERSDGIAIERFHVSGGVSPAIAALGSTVTLRDNIIENVSSASSYGDWAYGGCIHGRNSSVTLEGNTIQNCQAGQQGGAAYFVESDITAIGNEIRNNRAWNAGAGLYVFSSGGREIKISRNIFQNNVADYSGSVHISGRAYKSISVDHNVISHSGPDFTGGDLYVELTDSSRAIVVNNTTHGLLTNCCGRVTSAVYVRGGTGIYVANNVFSGGGHGYSVYAVDSDVTVEYNLNHGLDAAGRIGIPVPYHGVQLGPGNISQDPQYVGASVADYHLASGSPGIDAGSPDSLCSDADGSRLDMGAYGGECRARAPELASEYRQTLTRYASAAVRYFTSSAATNKLTGFTHSWFGTGDADQWRTCSNPGNCTAAPWGLTRGYGSHVNMNEVTLGLLSLAAAYKMEWLRFTPPDRAYAESWEQILVALRTMETMQTSGDPTQFANGHFHRSYLTTIARNNAYDLDRAPTEIVRPDWEDIQSSDDNALPYMNLMILEGLAKDTSVSIPDREIIVALCRRIRERIRLSEFLNDREQIAFNFTNGQLSAGTWDREAAEGPVILAAMLLSGQIDVPKFYRIASSLRSLPVGWSTNLGHTIHVDKPSYHSAMFIHGLRAIHGMPVTSREFQGLNFFETSIKPVLEAQIDYANYHGFKALGTQVMTQTFDAVPLFEYALGVQAQFPGNEENKMPIPASTLARATGPHAWFVPLARWRLLSESQIDWIMRHAAEYEQGFFHNGSDILLGWEAAIPWKPNETSPEKAWYGGGRYNYTDWGRPYEALNSAYIVLSLFDALNPDTPLASFSVEAERMNAIASYFDTGTLLPATRF
jgi:hypothetical protein